MSRLNKFLKNSKDPVLNDHQLHGRLSKLRSFNVKGEWIAVYEIKEGRFYFVLFDTHSNLFSNKRNN